MTNVLMPTLVGNKLFISQYIMDTNCFQIQLFRRTVCFVGRVAVHSRRLGGLLWGTVTPGLKPG